MIPWKPLSSMAPNTEKNITSKYIIDNYCSKQNLLILNNNTISYQGYKDLYIYLNNYYLIQVILLI